MRHRYRTFSHNAVFFAHLLVSPVIILHRSDKKKRDENVNIDKLQEQLLKRNFREIEKFHKVFYTIKTSNTFYSLSTYIIFVIRPLHLREKKMYLETK